MEDGDLVRCGRVEVGGEPKRGCNRGLIGGGDFVKRAQQQMVPLEKACKSNHASCEESRVVRKE